MRPASIVVMRHAEKTGDPNDRGLSPEGSERAHRLANWVPPTFQPDFLFAAESSPESERPVDTLAPLSAVLKKSVDHSFANRDHAMLVAALLSDRRYDGTVVLICWHHEKMPQLIRDLGGTNEGQFPDPWPDGLFNLVLSLKFGLAQSPVLTTVVEPF